MFKFQICKFGVLTGISFVTWIRNLKKKGKREIFRLVNFKPYQHMVDIQQDSFPWEKIEGLKF